MFSPKTFGRPIKQGPAVISETQVKL